MLNNSRHMTIQVVDTFAEARQRDILNLAEELEYDFDARFGGV